jgi:glyoxylase-like metal-dependent hydrolase (beta-lactamase superfamily II)
MLLEFPELRQLQEQKDIPMTAEKEISEKTVFDLGGIQCEVFPVISPHVDDCLLIYVPEERVLFSGDAHCPEVFGVDWIDEKERLSAFIRTLEQLEFDRCVTGHSDVMTKEELLKELKEREKL